MEATTLLLETLIPIAALTLFALLAVRFSYDSRDGSSVPPRPPLGSNA